MNDLEKAKNKQIDDLKQKHASELEEARSGKTALQKEVDELRKKLAAAVKDLEELRKKQAALRKDMEEKRAKVTTGIVQDKRSSQIFFGFSKKILL